MRIAQCIAARGDGTGDDGLNQLFELLASDFTLVADAVRKRTRALYAASEA